MVKVMAIFTIDLKIDVPEKLTKEQKKLR